MRFLLHRGIRIGAFALYFLLVLGTDQLVFPGLSPVAHGGFPYFFLLPLGFVLFSFTTGLTIAGSALLLILIRAISFNLDLVGVFFGHGVEAFFFYFVFFIGLLVLQSDRRSYKMMQELLRHTSHEKYHLIREKEAQNEIINELGHRLGFQQDSFLMLYSQVKKLDRTDFIGGMDTTLETVEIFTRCTKASLWRIDNREKRLELVNFLGYPKEDRPFPYKALDETLQGWVVQNNRPYSVRMLKEYPDLYALDDRVTIMAYPLVLQNRPWGVVSIEAMPFERYNHYTEVVVNILLRLLEPGLQRLYELDLNFDQTEWDEVTGLPRYSLLVRNLTSQLTQALRNESSVSLIMVEMKNLSTDEDAKLSILRLADNLEQEMPGQHRMYHFKNDNQLGVVIPNLDENGTARLCLNLLSRISSLSGAPDVLIGYSCSVGHDNPTGATLIGEVERIVELQRV